MRKLAWFAGGFAAACLFFCYVPSRALAAILCGLILLISFLLWRNTRPQPSESQILLFLPRRRRILFQTARRGLALCLGSILAFLWFGVYSALFYAPTTELADTEQTISGTVTSYPEETSIGGYSLTLRLNGGFRSPDLLLYGSEEWGILKPGDRVTCTARVKSSEFLYGDETTYYTARGLFLLGYCNDPPQVETAQRIPFRHWPDLCARALKSGIYAAFDHTAAPLAAAVTLGDKDALSDQTYSALNRSGIMHAAVVSGMHISFLVSVILFLSGGRRSIALCLVPLLVFYALMAGGTPSAFRAVIMQAALLAGPVLRREPDPPSSLGLALLVLLIQNPYAAASVSLQLSFLSVAGILLVTHRLFSALLNPVRARLRGKGRFARPLLTFWRFIAANIAVSLGAMLFTVPLIALYFGQIIVISPLTNVLTLWAVTALMVSALIVGTLALALPGIMTIPGAILGLLGHYVSAVTSVAGRWPLSCLDGTNPNFLIWLGAAYLLLLTILLSHRKWRQTAISILCLALLLGGAIGLNRLAVKRTELTVTALNVGQGASTLLLSGGHIALVDCGGNGQSNAGDLAADRLASTGVTKLDTLILTHLDDDHFNGVAQLFWRLDVGQVFLPEISTDSEHLALLLELAESEGATVTFVTETVSLPLGCSGLTLYPPMGAGTSNEEGLFVLCSRGDFDLLITGDADSFTEKMLVKYCPIPDIELLMVGHHGSKNSTCTEFLDILRPELAIISVGYNSYGHPAPETMDRLAAIGAQVYRTDEAGHITLRLREGEISIR